MAAPDYTTKVGDTFEFAGVYTDAAGDPIDLAAAQITIASSILSPDGSRLVALTVTKANQTTSPGQYTVSGATGDFDPGTWRWDLRFDSALTGASVSTRTMFVLFNEQVTP